MPLWRRYWVTEARARPRKNSSQRENFSNNTKSSRHRFMILQCWRSSDIVSQHIFLAFSLLPTPFPKLLCQSYHRKLVFVVACFVFHAPTLSAAVSSKDNRLFNRFWQRDKSDGVWANGFLMNHNENDNEIMAPYTLLAPFAFSGTRMIRNVCGGN